MKQTITLGSVALVLFAVTSCSHSLSNAPSMQGVSAEATAPAMEKTFLEMINSIPDADLRDTPEAYLRTLDGRSIMIYQSVSAGRIYGQRVAKQYKVKTRSYTPEKEWQDIPFVKGYILGYAQEKKE